MNSIILSKQAVILFILIVAGCGGGGGADSTLPAAQVNGVWDIAYNYGNGLIAHQNTTITQSANNLTFTTTDPDIYGPLLGPQPAYGYIYGDGLTASWTNTYGACRYFSRLEVTAISFKNFSGLLSWTRNGYGNGYCPAAIGQFSVRGL